jgi:hypothetical protein
MLLIAALGLDGRHSGDRTQINRELQSAPHRNGACHLQTDSKSFRDAAATLASIELMHMIRKGQMRTTGELRPAQQFYSLAE